MILTCVYVCGSCAAPKDVAAPPWFVFVSHAMATAAAEIAAEVSALVTAGTRAVDEASRRLVLLLGCSARGGANDGACDEEAAPRPVATLRVVGDEGEASSDRASAPIFMVLYDVSNMRRSSEALAAVYMTLLNLDDVGGATRMTGGGGGETMQPCGQCGGDCGGAHQCANCGCHMHAFCGDAVLDAEGQQLEGYGIAMVCRDGALSFHARR